jgi:tetratricopeptide (TPR) repeat protein
MEADYGVRDVERLLNLSRATIRALVDAGFVSPARGARNAWRFSFRDLIVLRTAQALVDANVPRRRITQAVRELRRSLPDAMPLSGLSITAVGDRVAVREGTRRWQADSGQYLLEFEPQEWGRTTSEHGALPQATEDADVPQTAYEWYESALTLEDEAVDAAIEAYQHAIAIDPALVDARINLGRLLHEARRFAKAEEVYRAAINAGGSDALLHFNYGVLLEDLKRGQEALHAYLAALRLDPTLADCHYNIALLHRALGRPKDAIRHLSQYRKLTGR